MMMNIGGDNNKIGQNPCSHHGGDRLRKGKKDVYRFGKVMLILTLYGKHAATIK